MSYRVSLGAATAALAKPLMASVVPGVVRGWDPYRPWGRAYVYLTDDLVAGDNPFNTSGTAGRMWSEHFLRPALEFKGSQELTSHCYSTSDGLFCIRPGEWSELKYSAFDPSSLQFFRERRVLWLLKRLSLPVGAFKTGIDAALYDASFNRALVRNDKLNKAVVKALKVYQSKFPQSRWKLVQNAVVLQSGDECRCEYPSWRPVRASGAPACESIITGQPAAVASSPSYAVGRVEASELPISAALAVAQLVGVGSTLIPTPWFSSLLKCLVPGWNK